MQSDGSYMISIAIFSMVTIGLLSGLSMSYILPRRQEIMANWGTYKYDPFLMFGAPFFKPEDDPRSRAEFAKDNFGDVMDSLANKIFLVFLQPVFELFNLFTKTLNGVLNNIFAFRDLLKNMFISFLRIFEPFMARFRTVSHKLRMTFLRLKDSIGRVAAVSTAAIFAGISTIRTMMNVFELMKNVAVALLIILVVMVIFFWFVLWPVTPLILTAIYMLIASGAAGEVGGMASTFCFGGETPIQLQEGVVPLQTVKVGDRLQDGETVQAVLTFSTPTRPQQFYDYKGIQVSGSHIVYEEIPRFVKDSIHATPLPSAPSVYYCLQTSNRRIPVRLPSKELIEFADWEELEEEDLDSLVEWNKTVEKSLNRIITSSGYPLILLQGESAMTATTLLQTLTGAVPIGRIRPGDWILGASGLPTRVLGVVRIHPSEVAYGSMLSEDGTALLSKRSWVRPAGHVLWMQMGRLPKRSMIPNHEGESWCNLFTEDGTFVLAEPGYDGWALRDYTDVGPDHIADTHDSTLEILRANQKKEGRVEP